MATCAFTFGDLFCTHIPTWWPILYMRSIITLWLIFLFCFGELFFTYFMADKFSYLCLPILYNYLLFILISHHFSLYTWDFYGLFCLFVSPSWPHLYIFYGDMCAYLWLPFCTLTSSLRPILCVWKSLTVYSYIPILT